MPFFCAHAVMSSRLRWKVFTVMMYLFRVCIRIFAESALTLEYFALTPSKNRSFKLSSGTRFRWNLQLSQNGGTKEAGFYDGDARQQENCLPKPKELASLKLASSSMA